MKGSTRAKTANPQTKTGTKVARLIDCGNDVMLERDVRFELSDGTTLVSDHYYPAGKPKAPTLLVRQPYGKDIATTVVYAHPLWFARHGFNVVIQDVRGRGESEGDFYPFRFEGKDGAETIEWLAGRPECNGRIGMYGFSYQGITQLLAAAEQPKGLQCLAPAQTCGDLYHGWFYLNGILRLASTLGWATQMLRSDAHRLNLKKQATALDAAMAGAAPFLHFTPYGKLPHLTAPRLPVYYADWVKHQQHDDYWKKLDISTRWNKIIHPALHVVGWYDTYLNGSIQLYENLAQKAGTAFARENQYLIAGPWQHIPWGNYIGEEDLGSSALVDTDEILLRWFNHWLKDSGEFKSEPKINLFALGENKWHPRTTWPGFAPQKSTQWFLHSGGKANSTRGNGSLTSSAPSSDELRDVFVYDPEVPVMAPGGMNAAPGPFTQNRLQQGNNVLVYTSPELKERFHLVGSPRVKLFAQTSRSTTDFVATLCKVDGRGKSTNITLGAARSDFLFARGGFKPDQVCCWEFSLEATSCVFQPGERIRLQISSSAYPLLDRNSGSSVHPAEATPRDWLRACQQIVHTPEAASCLELPGEA